MARKDRNSSQKGKATSSTNSKPSKKSEPTLDLYERGDEIATEGIDGKSSNAWYKETKAAMRRALEQD